MPHRPPPQRSSSPAPTPPPAAGSATARATPMPLREALPRSANLRASGCSAPSLNRTPPSRVLLFVYVFVFVRAPVRTRRTKLIRFGQGDPFLDPWPRLREPSEPSRSSSPSPATVPVLRCRFPLTPSSPCDGRLRACP